MSDIRYIGRTLAVAVALAGVVFVVMFLLATTILGQQTSPQEASAQEQTTDEHFNDPATVPPIDPVFPELEEDVSVEEGPAGIPELSIMDVIAHLDELPGTDFRCAGPTLTDGEAIKWTCFSPAGGLPGNHEVVVLANDPLSVLAVQVTARGLGDEEAIQFFDYVAALSLPDNEMLNAEAWVRANLRSGGQTFTGSTVLTLYGTKEVRTLEIVSEDFA